MTNLMIEFADQKFHLLPSGGIFWQDEEILILADLHLEKGSGFREQNNFLPPYDTQETLSLLQETIKNLSPKKVLLLGDSMHDSQSFHRMPLHLKKYLEAIMVESDLVWIRGNHDATIRGFPWALSNVFIAKAITFRHEMQVGFKGPEISGHFHPVGQIKFKGVKLTGRCFLLSEEKLIIPAFGTYTGGLNIKNAALSKVLTQKSKVFLIVSSSIFQVELDQLIEY